MNDIKKGRLIDLVKLDYAGNRSDEICYRLEQFGESLVGLYYFCGNMLKRISDKITYVNAVTLSDEKFSDMGGGEKDFDEEVKQIYPLKKVCYSGASYNDYLKYASNINSFDCTVQEVMQCSLTENIPVEDTFFAIINLLNKVEEDCAFKRAVSKIVQQYLQRYKVLDLQKISLIHSRFSVDNFKLANMDKIKWKIEKGDDLSSKAKEYNTDVLSLETYQKYLQNNLDKIEVTFIDSYDVSSKTFTNKIEIRDSESYKIF